MISPAFRLDESLLPKAVDAIRILSMDAVQRANSGHPGTPMALAPVATLLWSRHLRHNPGNPQWADRDRFVLSAGHASMLLYSLLHLSGYGLSLEELKNFRQWESRTPGHPEVHETPGVETTTGPLGQGVANSVGMALAERWLAARFNRPGHDVVDHRTWVLCSDGDLMEGISHEAAELAGHLKLDKLTWIFDDNRITIEGNTDLATSTDQMQRFQGYGWHVQVVEDGNEDMAGMDAALEAARAETGRPSLIVLRTTIAFGSPNMAGHHDTHGAPLGESEIQATRQNLGYPSQEAFHLEPEVVDAWKRLGGRGEELEGEWDRRFSAYQVVFPELAAELRGYLSGTLPTGWDDALNELQAPAKAEATRASSGRALQAVAGAIPNLVGGSADLGPSNKSVMEEATSFSASNPGGRNLHFGIREHAMGGILNGMALHGGVRGYGATFLIFSDYMRPAIRLASLMGLPVTYLFTHDSIGLGEDGPTHQPVEQLMALRAIPGLMDLRPADWAETVAAWRVAMGRSDGPAFLSLTRQSVPQMDQSRPGVGSAAGVARGGYVLKEASGGAPGAILLASGSEVGIALDAAAELEGDGIPTRVVSLPSWHLFASQPRAYRAEVLPPEVTIRVSVEAGITHGWERWVGDAGVSIGVDRFGASAPAPELYRHFGVTSEAVVAAVRELLDG
ncbi:MAG: transketolase [Gemmatimonadota bacterium]